LNPRFSSRFESFNSFIFFLQRIKAKKEEELKERNKPSDLRRSMNKRLN